MKISSLREGRGQVGVRRFWRECLLSGHQPSAFG
jgi:hypothetical protein